MLTSIYLVSTLRRVRSYLIGALTAVLLLAGSVAYEVRPGDTLSAIASEHGIPLHELIAANDIADPDLIQPGQEVVIPGDGGEPDRVHVVEAGETLADIAHRYRASISRLAEANELSNPSLIRVGQRLSIPGGGESNGSISFHIVEEGETLSSIAAQHGVTVEQLAEANGITDPTRIYVGARLALSGDTFVASSGEGATTHTVEAGDTVGSIARQYGVGVADIARANGLDDVDRIRVGQELAIPGAGGWVCPVTGATYMNDWGLPRADERFHEGTDLFAPRGTEVVAPVGGSIDLITGKVGGLQFYLYGDDGTTYIGTHLDAFGRSGRVEAGEVIGYVGDSGNARGGPTHLHLEMHPDDGEAVNPFPTLKDAGC